MLFNKIIRHLFTIGAAEPRNMIVGNEIPEDQDPTPVDMEPQTKAPADGDTADPADESGDQGSEGEESSPGSGLATSEETSATPSGDGNDPAATAPEAGAGSVTEVVRNALIASIESTLASAGEIDDRPRKVRFKPTITKEMLENYEKRTAEGKEGEALADLLGAAIEEFGQLYDAAFVQPAEKVLGEIERERRNASRVAQWAKQNPTRASDKRLFDKMAEVYNGFATKYGQRKADRISVEQLAALADLDLGTKPAPQKTAPDPDVEKRKALGANAVPQGVGTIRGGKAQQVKPKVAHTGAGYRDYLKAVNRDPF